MTKDAGKRPPLDFPMPIEIAKAPHNWLTKAMEFRTAAEVLVKQKTTASRHIHDSDGQPIDAEVAHRFNVAGLDLSCRLMMGYACELLLKAIIVQRTTDLFEQNKKAPHWFRIHDINELAGIADVPIPSDIKDFLDGLTHTVSWGRYPSTKDQDGIFIKSDGKWRRGKPYHPHVSYYIPEIYEMFMQFYNSAMDIYMKGQQ